MSRRAFHPDGSQTGRGRVDDRSVGSARRDPDCVLTCRTMRAVPGAASGETPFRWRVGSGGERCRWQGTSSSPCRPHARTRGASDGATDSQKAKSSHASLRSTVTRVTRHASEPRACESLQDRPRNANPPSTTGGSPSGRARAQGGETMLPCVPPRWPCAALGENSRTCPGDDDACQRSANVARESRLSWEFRWFRGCSYAESSGKGGASRGC